MNKAYPIILEPAEEGGYLVYIPDFDIYTQGDDYAEALFMARDAICCWILDLTIDSKDIPEPSDFSSVNLDEKLNQMKLMVDIDFDKYRREYDTRSVRKNCTIPAWLSDAAMKQNLNFSQILQNALKTELGIQ